MASCRSGGTAQIVIETNIKPSDTDSCVIQSLNVLSNAFETNSDTLRHAVSVGCGGLVHDHFWPPTAHQQPTQPAQDQFRREVISRKAGPNFCLAEMKEQ